MATPSGTASAPRCAVHKASPDARHDATGLAFLATRSSLARRSSSPGSLSSSVSMRAMAMLARDGSACASFLIVRPLMVTICQGRRHNLVIRRTAQRVMVQSHTAQFCPNAQHPQTMTINCLQCSSALINEVTSTDQSTHSNCCFVATASRATCAFCQSGHRPHSVDREMLLTSPMAS